MHVARCFRFNFIHSSSSRQRASSELRAMSSDGCQRPTWTGQAFSYMLHQPAKPDSYRSVKTVASTGDVAPAPRQQAATGTWNGPAPRGMATAVNASANPAATSASEREPDSVQLPRGAGRMPLIGFGTYKVDSVDSIRSALEAGYRHLDCAPVYGNEALVGEAIAPWLRQHGRDSLFLVSKVWNDAHRPDAVRESCKKTIADLQCGHLDLLLMHWPDAWVPGSDKEVDTTVTIEDTWKAMEGLVDDGSVKAIGVSNFNLAQTERLLAAARIPPVVNQVELHPLLSQRKLVGTCLRKGVTCTAYGPLGHSKTDLLQHLEVAAVAKEVLLRWNVQRGVAVIPKASSPDHMADNINGLFEWRLSYDQKAKLDALDQGKRFIDSDWHDWEAC